MNESFGIDHPLLATKDINALRDRLISLGFNMTPIGKHPWGTSTSLAMFNGCLVEIMGIYDDTLLDEVPAGDFRFGRHVYEHLQQREGVALSALHSTNSVEDAQTAERVGFTVAGHLEFGRDVTLPDGTAGRTKTTLALLPDAQFPRLSFFLCQQHRPDLIYVPEWLEHPNSVSGICGVNILADTSFHAELKARFGGLYTGLTELNGGFEFQTANGTLRVMSADAFEREIGPLPNDLAQETLPCIAGMDLTLRDPDKLLKFLNASNLGYRTIPNGFALTDPALTANTLLRFLSK
ncbi:Glyoxalase-like domain-containing protein [Litoreibacter ascidiaceicola]|uniref:Glyoxalase-like domain-containing protein n=1 Tax=Litoreibacter ascidiaceicola TaxID=1486859 RepID=A0A1M4ZK03_9RHOB|nr:VOC family protein [Litoreibacter ascidiaceicola]SHF18400.1 Glyoxalase-like domain-containing protein [Litoreibacter ascidiaceicola]